jgi:hypothetical protein
MKISWKRFFRRVASVLFVGGATAYSSAMCYAVQVAFDSASDPVYADGWQGSVTNSGPPTIGDNGGFGFTPWNFDQDTAFEVKGILDINGPAPNQSPFNQVGASWRMGLEFLDQGKDIVRVGRGLASPLQVGQTISIVTDPPSDMAFFDIEHITLNSGGGNLCYGGEACSPGTMPEVRFQWSYFNWTDSENWGRWSATSIGATPLFNQDKAPGGVAPDGHPDFPQGAAGTDMGMRLDFTLTGAETFSLTVTPLDNSAAAFTGTGTLDNTGSGPIDWIGFQHYGSESDDSIPTDFYIRSLEVSSATAPADADFDNDGDVDGGDFLRWQGGVGTTVGATNAQGNADGDSDVDGADLAIWKQKYGPGSPGPGASAIPEPASITCALLAGAGWAARAGATRKRRRT